jgi:hypothetical protein
VIENTQFYIWFNVYQPVLRKASGRNWRINFMWQSRYRLASGRCLLPLSAGTTVVLSSSWFTRVTPDKYWNCNSMTPRLSLNPFQIILLQLLCHQRYVVWDTDVIKWIGKKCIKWAVSSAQMYPIFSIRNTELFASTSRLVSVFTLTFCTTLNPVRSNS